jgi:RNA polymerase sigma-70 factor (family 1)
VEKHKNYYQDMHYFSKLKAGEEKAFDYFFNQYYSGMCVFGNKFMKNPHLTEEIVQDVFLKFWRGRKAIDINTSIKSYLFASVKNQCIDVLKHRKVSNEYIEKMIKSLPGSKNETWDTFVESELYELLVKAVEKLPPECQKIFRDSRFKHLPNKEIALKLELSIKTVENQLTKALKIIKNELKDYLQV